jgi:hypothetical protein
MSDAANNALLFEEEIDVRVIDAFIKALDDKNPRISEPMRYMMGRLVRHEAFREYITKEVTYQVENALRRYMQAQYPPGKERDYRGASLKEPFYKW